VYVCMCVSMSLCVSVYLESGLFFKKVCLYVSMSLCVSVYLCLCLSVAVCLSLCDCLCVSVSVSPLSSHTLSALSPSLLSFTLSLPLSLSLSLSLCLSCRYTHMPAGDSGRLFQGRSCFESGLASLSQ